MTKLHNIMKIFGVVYRPCLGWLYRPILRQLPRVALRINAWWYRAFVLPRLVSRVSQKRPINVVFLTMNTSMWRYDGVYRMMLEDCRFNPIILTAMRMNESVEEQIRDQDNMIDTFSKRGYRVIPGYDAGTGSWRSLESVNPDVVFYTQQYSIALIPDYGCERVKNYALICFAPYSLPLVSKEYNYNSPLHNFAWKNFMVSPQYLSIARSFSFIKCGNAAVVGYGVEEEIRQAIYNNAANNNTAKAWPKSKGKKKLIWAPHHDFSDECTLRIGAFLEISNEMLEIRDKFKDSLVIAFKPHPMLITKLYRYWGKERTDTYYRQWANGENSFLADGVYIDLFAQSDGMLHDSSSFVIEYLYANKPVAYYYRKNWSAPDYNAVARGALEVHYAIRTIAGIEDFIERVLLSGEDEMSSLRNKFVATWLRSGDLSFSVGVINALVKGLAWQ